jgi:outer membrane lipopolysaccharide assembly protein LptE/RlpB
MRLLAVLLLTLFLAGCGFKPAVTWSKVDGPVSIISAEPFSPVQRELNLLVQQSLAEYDELPSPDGVRRIELAPAQITTDVITVDSNGRPAEYLLQYQQQAEFTINDAVYNEVFTQRREYVFDVRDILAYQQQVEQLKRTMSSRLAQQILFAYSARLQNGSAD